MSEPKPFASLSSGLLARKGAARPAMRPQGFGQSGAGLEDLGWNDMGFDPPKAAPAVRDVEHDAFGEDVVDHPRSHHPTGLTPVDSPVHGQHAALADRFGQGDDEEESFDEEYDETAELYDPAAEADSGEESDEEGEDEEQPAYSVRDLAPAREPIAAFVAPEPVETVAEPISEPVAKLVSPAPRPSRAPRARSAPGSKEKAAFTLRLDKDRHLKLRLACAVRGRSAQMLVTDALDRLLAEMPEVDDLAGKTNRKG